MTKNNATHGPFTLRETREFIGSVVAQSDSKNHRFDLDTAAECLADQPFDECFLWETLETYRIDKTSKASYRVGTKGW